MNNTRLKPCPFCGGDGEILTTKTRQGQKSSVSCSKCTCKLTAFEPAYYEGNIEQDVVDEWNTRYDYASASNEEESVKRGRWVYWSGWCGNHDMRIEDAVCSECGYKHPTVRWELGDPRSDEFVLNKLKDGCPKCGAIMQKE